MVWVEMRWMRLPAHRIYEAKGRPSDNPLIIHIAEMEHLDKIVEEVPEGGA